MRTINSLIILGPTASGKTRLAVQAANALQGAVMSCDSRQVYKELNIGTGKDLQEYLVNNKFIPHYLVDLCSIRDEFHIYDFVEQFIDAFARVKELKLLPVLCGGTGLYLDALLKQHQYINIPKDPAFRNASATALTQELEQKLNTYPKEFRSHADASTHKRLVRALEVASFLASGDHVKINYPELHPLIFGIQLSVKDRDQRIHDRLQERVQNGLIEEIARLLEQGINPERLIGLGLEYKFITENLLQQTNKEEMLQRLETAIRQYAKRQMTWFRKMEKEGFAINWIDGLMPLEKQLEQLLQKLKSTD